MNVCWPTWNESHGKSENSELNIHPSVGAGQVFRAKDLLSENVVETSQDTVTTDYQRRRHHRQPIGCHPGSCAEGSCAHQGTREHEVPAGDKSMVDDNSLADFGDDIPDPSDCDERSGLLKREADRLRLGHVIDEPHIIGVVSAEIDPSYHPIADVSE